MPRFLVIGEYSAEGARGLMAAGGSARKAAVEKMVAGLGGRLETFDFAFGGDDVYVTVDMPDSESAAAVALTVSGSGAVRARTVVLLTPDQIDRAAQVRPDYTAPGQTG
ncbi:GYD domain-containing protein [Modestobacter altitudinis]|uniref:GYD domain-containing protein n=1 Tax=Modestobacter altitudinis TaxID=2213158 RepID=UPI00110CC40D|nr:GYD domain-containing protein [Modestobacter altitudinis]